MPTKPIGLPPSSMRSFNFVSASLADVVPKMKSVLWVNPTTKTNDENCPESLPFFSSRMMSLLFLKFLPPLPRNSGCVWKSCADGRRFSADQESHPIHPNIRPRSVFPLDALDDLYCLIGHCATPAD